MRAVRGLLIVLPILFMGAGQQQNNNKTYLLDFPGPQVFKDSASGTLLYIESDGRHVAAISHDGKLLWNRDPFKDAHLPFYRTEKPQIVYILPASKSQIPAGEKPDKFVGVSFNNSQFGVMRIGDGDFYFVGQD
jgi:hypothetical protein